MKRTLIIILAVLIPFVGNAGTVQKQKKAEKIDTELVSLISEYSFVDGFDVVRVGGLGASLLKTVVRKSLDTRDPDERAIYELISSIKKVYIVDYDDCDYSSKEKFNRKVSKYLGEDNLLMSVKDDGENMNVYGIVSEDGGKIKNFILHSPDSNALICLFGTISMDSLSKLMNER